MEKDNVKSPTDHSNPVTIVSSSENILNNNETSTRDSSEVHEDISHNNEGNKITVKQENNSIDTNTSIPDTTNIDANTSIPETANSDTYKQENDSVVADISISEIDNPETHELSQESSTKEKKKVDRKLGFLQMRIDSTIYFDNMGYSYQIQNEKNDKK